MEFTSQEKIKLGAKLEKFCYEFFSDEQKKTVQLDYEIGINSVTLFKSKPTYTGSSKWVNFPIALSFYDFDNKNWLLYHWNDQEKNWDHYFDLEPVGRIDPIFEEIEDDPLEIFFNWFPVSL